MIELFRILQEIDGKDKREEIIFDFKNINFVRPLFILTLSGLIYQLKKQGRKVSCINNYQEYLNYICFNDGFKPDEDPDWEMFLSHYSEKNYIPILNFPTSKGEKEVLLRNNAISSLNKI